MSALFECTTHRGVFLPVPEREAERIFCPLCAQAGRSATYARQREETAQWLKSPRPTPARPPAPPSGS